MRTARYLLAAATLATLTGCGAGQPPNQPAPSSRPSLPSSRPPGTPAVAPPAPHPARTANCPYLDRDGVARTNGQHVGKVRIGAPGADGPHPACFFYRPDGSLQLTVRVYVGSADVAHALIDAAAPVATSAMANDPAGWTGGEQPTRDGAVYAVTKGNAAVVVTTNQHQTIKAREVAEQTITGLRL